MCAGWREIMDTQFYPEYRLYAMAAEHLSHGDLDYTRFKTIVNYHYYGHPEKSFEMVKDIVWSLGSEGIALSKDDMERLFYYVRYHDDRISLREKHLKRHLKMVDVETFKNLMELQIADAKAHVIFPIIQERIDICSEWKNGRADMIKAKLDAKSNVQFGEGGAGTFSDGKLNTLVKDTFGRNKEMGDTEVGIVCCQSAKV